MRAVRIALPAHTSLTLTATHLLALASALVAAMILVFYVQLLHAAVERGASANTTRRLAAALPAPAPHATSFGTAAVVGSAR